MFERYTERARRVIFFSRYEANTFGSPFIEPEHVLLGLLRECQTARDLLNSETEALVREALERTKKRASPVSVDLPLSHDSQRILSFACEEAEAAGNREIECQHLLLAFLRIETSAIRGVLEEQNGPLDILLERARRGQQPRSIQAQPPGQVVYGPELFVGWVRAMTGEPAPDFAPLHQRLSGLLLRSAELIDYFSPAYGDARLHRKSWTRKQALVYLIDWASQYRLWLRQAALEAHLRADQFPPEKGVRMQTYQDVPWQFVVDSWFSANCLLLIDIAALPSAKAATPCRIGLDKPVTLNELLARYLDTVEDTMEQVFARL